VAFHVVGGLEDDERLRQEQAEYRAKIGEEIAQMIEGYSAGQILMAAGEMTAQEMRSVRAVQRWWASAVRQRCKICD
jgi:hypothetical protein